MGPDYVADLKYCVSFQSSAFRKYIQTQHKGHKDRVYNLLGEGTKWACSRKEKTRGGLGENMITVYKYLQGNNRNEERELFHSQKMVDKEQWPEAKEGKKFRLDIKQKFSTVTAFGWRLPMEVTG